MPAPDAQRPQLLATFNAGFIYADGHNGSSDNGQTNEPLTDGLATLVGYPTGASTSSPGTAAPPSAPATRSPAKACRR
jgi:hypothetical protein